MARVNVYLPDELAAAVKESDLNVSSVTQAALVSALGARNTDRWLDDLERLSATKATHVEVVASVRAAGDEFGA